MTNHEALPWLPIHPGFSLKVLSANVERDERVLLLRLEPNATIARHRHAGDVHAYTLTGARELDNGERVAAGDYVYEPVGNVDSWRTIGDAPVVVLAIVRGALAYIDDRGATISRSDTASLSRQYAELQAQLRANDLR